MTRVTKWVALTAGVGLVTLVVSAGVRASAQNTNQDPGSFSQQRMGPPPGMGRGGPGGWLGPGGGPLGMLHMLGLGVHLTDAQREQLKSIADAHKEEWKALADRSRTAHAALVDAVTAATVDESLIRAKASDVAAVEADIAVASAQARAEAWQILTPEQQAQAAKFQSEVRNRMRARRGAMRHRIGRLLGLGN